MGIEQTLSRESVDKRKSLFVSGLFLLILIAPSPIFGQILPLPGTLLLIASVSTLFLAQPRVVIPLQVLIFISLTLFLHSISNIYWGKFLTFQLLYSTLSIIVAAAISKRNSEKFVGLMSKMLVLLVIFGLIGQLYFVLGGQPVYEFNNPDGRPAYLYASTFSNSVSVYIRPSGIYDEPGSLSFFICLCVALRERFQLPRKTSILMLVGGMVTLSIAHVIFSFFYAVHCILVLRKEKSFRYTPNILWGSVFIITVLMFGWGVFDRLFSFGLFYEYGPIGTRLNLMKNAITYLGSSEFFWGLTAKPEELSVYKNIGENPLSLLVAQGVFRSFTYYFVCLTLLLVSIKDRNLIPLAFFFLLLQRPNVMNYEYAFPIMLYWLSLFRTGISFK